jgi:GTP diphosphokinase / guanosine-3',5'-bis(diphosphate) 3'-diphosphatase
MYKHEKLRPEIGFVNKVEEFLPRREKVRLALEKAIEVHEGVYRKSGEPYVSHCVAVASILESWGLRQEDHESLFCAALLHDSYEDTDYDLKNIEEDFGGKVAELVDGVSKFRSKEKTDKVDIDGETLKKVVMKSFIEPKVLLLKLADRLHNMRTLWAMDEEKRAPKALETLNVYVPLTESLGMWVVKTELEDLAFSYINPRKHEEIRREIDGDKRFERKFIEGVVENIEGLLERSNLQGELGIRVGGYWKSYKKREKAGMKGLSGLESFSDINDILSLRVCFESVDNCYQFLSMLRQYFGELVDEDRADDFISIAPRDNGYKALQETIGFKEGAVEVAMMTKDMEEFNNWGVVSLLKQGERDLSDYRLILLFTPAGDVRFLPIGANGIDFAARINRSLLANMVGVRVDGKEYDLNEALPNGVTIEILTSDNGEAIVTDSLLKNELLPGTRRVIEDLLKQREHDRLVDRGEDLMESVLADRGLFCLGDILGVRPGWSGKISRVLFEFGCGDLRDLYYKFACGALTPIRLDNFLDEVGISKSGLHLVSVSLCGANRPGVLADVSEIIGSVGGDVVNLCLSWEGDGDYRLRLVIEGLLGKEDDLVSLLSGGDWSEDVVVV